MNSQNTIFRVEFKFDSEPSSGLPSSSVIVPLTLVNNRPFDILSTKLRVYEALKESIPLFGCFCVTNFDAGSRVRLSADDGQHSLNDSTSLTEYVKWVASTPPPHRFIHASIRVTIEGAQRRILQQREGRTRAGDRLQNPGNPHAQDVVDIESAGETALASQEGEGSQGNQQVLAEEEAQAAVNVAMKNLKEMFAAVEGLTDDVQNQLLAYLIAEVADASILTRCEQAYAEDLVVKGRLMMRLYLKHGFEHQLTGTAKTAFFVTCGKCSTEIDSTKIKLTNQKLGNFNQHLERCGRKKRKATERLQDLIRLKRQRQILSSAVEILTDPIVEHMDRETKRIWKERCELKDTIVTKLKLLGSAEKDPKKNRFAETKNDVELILADFAKVHLSRHITSNTKELLGVSVLNWRETDINSLDLDELRLLHAQVSLLFKSWLCILSTRSSVVCRAEGCRVTQFALDSDYGWGSFANHDHILGIRPEGRKRTRTSQPGP